MSDYKFLKDWSRQDKLLATIGATVALAYAWLVIVMVTV